jgi:hypothetical protein
MFTKSDTHNPNYLASIVKIDNIRQHSNADRLQCTNVFFNNVITGMNAKIGDLVVYFPIESQISEDFLSYTNSFEDKELNADKSIKGYFSSKRRVRCMGLRNEKSQGYIVPVSELENFAKDILGKKISIDDSFVGTDFDMFFDHLLCKKYVPANQRTPNVAGSKKSKGNVKKYISKLVENQFRFHESTLHLKKFVNEISPNDYIAITNKLHGCNFVVAKVLVKRKLSLIDKIAKLFSAKIQETEYGMLYSSRAVLKNQFLNDDKEHNHYYDADIWKIVADKIYPFLDEGITIYGEIVGHTPTGSFIQKQYDYACNIGELDFFVFKITYTTPTGKCVIFSHRETVEWCSKYAFKMTPAFYYGKAKDLFPELDTENHWHENFLQKAQDAYLEKKCDICKNDVWSEGIVLRVDDPNNWRVYKLKSFNFLNHESAELDSGEENMDL